MSSDKPHDYVPDAEAMRAALYGVVWKEHVSVIRAIEERNKKGLPRGVKPMKWREIAYAILWADDQMKEMQEHIELLEGRVKVAPKAWER